MHEEKKTKFKDINQVTRTPPPPPETLFLFGFTSTLGTCHGCILIIMNASLLREILIIL